MAAIAAAVLTVPAAVAANGSAESPSGGGVSYEEAAADETRTSMRVAEGAWVGRATRVSGTAPARTGEKVVIQSRRSIRRGWTPVASARVDRRGEFDAQWRPASSGRHELRAVTRSASTARAGARAASPATRVTVYRRVTATWYGPGFYGNRTACGQRLTKRTVGVAHRTLPCGTRVALRAGRRSTVVRVIDRGPYAHGVSYDLTSATAERLGIDSTRRIGAAVIAR